eukprot:TRINITY_DN10425_c0_g1_i1.p1 TRINITY_DN10425_c0_g1~~TRINITY_DN10425_c0_g1_i1.p1  ORF type:complete len:118 (-),score=25.68 TRINITY_DN10425_c0_g1_i1:72-425(-)
MDIEDDNDDKEDSREYIADVERQLQALDQMEIEDFEENDLSPTNSFGHIEWLPNNSHRPTIYGSPGVIEEEEPTGLSPFIRDNQHAVAQLQAELNILGSLLNRSRAQILSPTAPFQH